MTKEKDRPADGGTGPNTTNLDETKSNRTHRHPPTVSREIDWFRVYKFIEPLITRLGRPLPWPGTPTWCELSDHDPAKLGAVLVAGVLWALNEDARQDASCQASNDISAGYDWGAIAQHIYDREMFYREKPYLARRTAS